MKNQNPTALVFILVLLSGIFIFQSSNAQSEFGIKGGILFSTINAGKDVSSNLGFEKKDGYSVGAFYRKSNLVGPIGFQGELLYQLKGANVFIENYEFTDPGTSSYEDYLSELNDPKSFYRSKEILHYFSLPLLLTVKTTKFLDLYAGPEINYLISKKTNRIETDKENQFTMGIAMGATLKLSSSTSLDLRYSTDLTPYDDMGSEQNPLTIKNQGFAISIQQTLFRNK